MGFAIMAEDVTDEEVLTKLVSGLEGQAVDVDYLRPNGKKVCVDGEALGVDDGGLRLLVSRQEVDDAPMRSVRVVTAERSIELAAITEIRVL